MDALEEPDREVAPHLPEIKIVVICGPTGSGKSSLAIQLAPKYNAEIISADSKQIYKPIKIGTARLSAEEKQGITHHLMGCCDLGERFTAFDFVKRAGEIINHLNRQGKRVIICGGTGLYLRALIEGIFEVPDEDMDYRNRLIALAAEKGPSHIHRMLAEVDPDEAATIHPHNMIKTIRALEIYYLTGKTKSGLKLTTKPTNDNFKFLQIILFPDRNLLYKKIDKRVDQMIATGLPEETRSIYDSPIGQALKEKKIVGYAEIIEHIENEISLERAIELIKQNSRRYAKRQITWFKAVGNQSPIIGFGADAFEPARQIIEQFWI